ncbi:hypothetical protein G7077_01800 [Sphingomonas piscis]|uniref:Uncharacterized protein n=1 Tax=Sphingomonas piscis TaxID=2714943 RepID=A0A6G7YM63_9SPHN|nr:hypothetical protein [Sphingomonas piscis]QIK77834.1 hypothetical protein G7077_01800 [Sphingomonas piscis]
MGERHVVSLRVPGPEAPAVVARLTDGIEEAEFTIPGQIVADIALTGAPQARNDGSIEVSLEALTIGD